MPTGLSNPFLFDRETGCRDQALFDLAIPSIFPKLVPPDRATFDKRSNHCISFCLQLQKKNFSAPPMQRIETRAVLREIANLDRRWFFKLCSAEHTLRLLSLLVNPARHVLMVRAVASPAFRNIRRRQPQLTRKYLNREHLVLGWTPGQRADAMVHHYRFLETRLAPACIGPVLDGIGFFEMEAPNGPYKLSIGFSHPTDNEGELSLTFETGGFSIYVMSFSFVPGRLVTSPADTVILITRIQGASERFNLIRGCTKAMNGLPIPMIFMAAIQGLAQRLGLSEAFGIRADSQVCHGKHDAEHHRHIYDSFFQSLGGVQTGDFFRITLPLEVKPINLIKSHRVRVRKKREIKQQVIDSLHDVIALR